MLVLCAHVSLHVVIHDDYGRGELRAQEDCQADRQHITY
jgi:hypothetical protein